LKNQQWKISGCKALALKFQPEAYETNILDSALPQHVSVILQEAGYATVGDLAER
jgi:hypothetical protein